MADNFQRSGSISNAHVGRDFEVTAIAEFAAVGIPLSRDFGVSVGINSETKIHRFDLGSESPPILVECKSHRWTAGSNVPSAKVTVWNEAMYYFHCAPARYRKILFVLSDRRLTTNETLASYYIRTYSHLIPEGVAIWEFDEESNQSRVLYGA